MDALKSSQHLSHANPLSRRPKLELETAVAVLGTGLVVAILVLKAYNAGPLWRDETNSANVAQAPSLKEFWNNMAFESFPPLWLFLLRGWSLLGIANSDTGIRLLGLLIGLFFLGSLWLCSYWTRGRPPIVSLALLGGMPALIFTLGSNRAYGLALCLTVLSFGAIWRMLECPSKTRAVWTGVIMLLFLHCVYYDLVFLCAMLFGAALVLLRRREWKTLTVMATIGAISGVSLLIYTPVVRRGSPYLAMIQMPFHLSTLWPRLCGAVTAQYSAYWGAPPGPEIWFWVFLIFLGLSVSIGMQIHWFRQARSDVPGRSPLATSSRTQRDADLALFSGASMVGGVLGHIAFLLNLHFLTQPWYYVGMLTLCAVSLDGVLGSAWPALRPWGALRVGFLAFMLAWYSRSAWAEAQTRYSNVDIIAAALDSNAKEGDLIVVQEAWEGISFDRYYRGKARWATVPPIASHKVHRNDLMWDQLNQDDAMAPLFAEVTATLRNGKNVWLMGHSSLMNTKQVPPTNRSTKWLLGPSMRYWNSQLMAHLITCSQQAVIVELPTTKPVSSLENISLRRFSGFQSTNH